MNDDEDDYTRDVIENDLNIRTIRTLQQWAKDCAMRYEAVGIPAGSNLMTALVRVLVGTLIKARMPKAALLELIGSAYDALAEEQQERKHASDR